MQDPPETPPASSAVLERLWRAAALITADVDAASRVMRATALAHPRPERARESALVATMIENAAAVRADERSPAPLPLDEANATALARLRAAIDLPSLALWVGADAMAIDERVLANARRESLEETQHTLGETRRLISETLGRDHESASSELRRAIEGFDAHAGLAPARAAIASARVHRVRAAAAAFAVFALVVVALVYVKIDLARAAEEEKRALPSLEKRFSNPAPPDSDDRAAS